MTRQTISDLGVGFAGVVYLALVLFGGIQMPVFGVALLLLAAYAIIRPHRTSSRH